MNPNRLTDNQPERELWQGSFSGRSMFGAWVAAIFITIALIAAISLVTELRTNPFVWLFGASVIVLMWIGLVSTWLYQRWGHFYEVTTERIKHRDGILVRRMGLIELIDIDDVSYQQGPIQSLLGVGNIHLTSSDVSHPSLTMRGISNIRWVAEMIDEARRDERRKRGLHIESI